MTIDCKGGYFALISWYRCHAGPGFQIGCTSDSEIKRQKIQSVSLNTKMPTEFHLTFFIFRTGLRICWSCQWGQGSQGAGACGLPIQVAGGGGHLARAKGEARAACRARPGHARVVGPWKARLWSRYGGGKVSQEPTIALNSSHCEAIIRQPYTSLRKVPHLFADGFFKVETGKVTRKNTSLIQLINGPGGCLKTTR